MLERSFSYYAKRAELPAWEPEHRFAAHHVGLGPKLRERLAAAGLKDWRFDAAWIKERVYVELEGGVYSGGRHVRGAGFTGDAEKYNAATILGWRGLRFTSQMLKKDPMGCMDRVKGLLKG
jgi:very-short-patch-repair endonuclease